MNEFNIIFPCVLKPVDGMQGKDVNTFIKNKMLRIEKWNAIIS
jgi:glutathione synthase/RimK-type ligase-like ATP-grasp enzyme